MSVRNPIPNFIDQIKFLKFYMFNPCDAPFMLYIESARPFAYEIAMTLLAFDLVGFVKSLIRPKWVRSWRKVKRGAKPRRRRGGIPEPNDLIADKLDPHRYMRVPTWTFAGNMVFEIHDRFERVFWTIFLFEMVEGFIFNTIIAVIEADKSGCPHIGRMLRTDPSVTVTGAGSQWKSINVSHIEYINNCASSSGHTATPQEGEWVFTYSCHYRAAVFDSTGIKFRLRNMDTEEIIDEIGPFDIPLGEFRDCVISGPIDAGQTCTWEINVGFGNIVMLENRVFAMQIGT